MAFANGQLVEVIDYAPGFKKSYYIATLIGCDDDWVTVKYDTLKDVNGDPLVDEVPIINVRPIPWKVDVRIEDNDFVNAWDGKGWRWGTCVGTQEDLYKVDFGYSQSEEENVGVYGKKDLRINQETSLVSGGWLWCYHKKDTFEFTRGNRVEIIGCEEGMENSFYAGSIVGFTWNARVKVKYETLTHDNGQPLIQEFTRSDIRPYPPNVKNVVIGVGDVVDAWDGDGWWMGKCTDVDWRTGVFSVLFDYVDEPEERNKNYARQDIRIHQHWFPVDCFRFWCYRKV